MQAIISEHINNPPIYGSYLFMEWVNEYYMVYIELVHLNYGQYNAKRLLLCKQGEHLSEYLINKLLVLDKESLLFLILVLSSTPGS